MKHCPVTGDPIPQCDCGACDDLDVPEQDCGDTESGPGL